jgi:peptidoglycan/LPS O-acetylase OafA/YrhL
VSSVVNSTEAPRRPERDRFLDLLRLIAVVRVVLLHTCTKPPVVYLPWIQWIFPGMAEVFFVSGVVTAASLARRRGRDVVRARLRRLLPPFYAYAVVALAVMAVTDARSKSPTASLHRSDVLSFLLPVVRPTGSTTRVILWGHLWFLTAFLWVIVLAPLTHRLYRRFGPTALLLHPAVFAVLVWCDKRGLFVVREEMYTVAMFGWFFQLGYAYSDGRIQRIGPRRLLTTGIALFAAGWLVAERIEPVWRKPVKEMYASQSAHFLVGAAWMLAVLACQRPITRWLGIHRLRVLDVVTQRTYTLFVWGPAANAVAMAASRNVGGSGGHLGVYLLVTMVALAAMVLAFGWIEDLASRRGPQLLPGWRVGRKPALTPRGSTFPTRS